MHFIKGGWLQSQEENRLFTGPGWTVPRQVNQVQGKGFLLCPGSLKVCRESIPEHKAVKALGVRARQLLPRLALLRGSRAKKST